MLVRILDYLVPDWQAVIVGEPASETDYLENVDWQDLRSQPTWSEIELARPVVEKQLLENEAKNNRANAYRSESDPLYFGWQRNENTEQAWLDKVAEIRTRYPYPA